MNAEVPTEVRKVIIGNIAIAIGVD